MSGTGGCPQEGVGGTHCYYELLKAFDDPKSGYREWFPDFFERGERIDPEDAELAEKIVTLKLMENLES